MIQTFDKGPITSSDFCSSLAKFEFVATSRLPALFSNIRSLINSSIFLGGWRLRRTGFSTKMLSCKCFSGINLLKWSFMYLAKFSGRSHLNSSCFGTARNLLKSTNLFKSVSETSLSLSVSSRRFREGFSLAASVAENPDGCCEVFPLAVFSASVSLAKLHLFFLYKHNDYKHIEAEIS